MVRAATSRVSRPVRPACCAEASRRTPTSRPGLGRSAYLRPRTVAEPDVGGVRPTMTRMVVDLPGAVRTEESGHAARLGGEGDVVDGAEAAVRPGECGRLRSWGQRSRRPGVGHIGERPHPPLCRPLSSSQGHPAAGRNMTARLAGVPWRAHRDLVRRRLSVVLHRQAPPGDGPGRLRRTPTTSRSSTAPSSSTPSAPDGPGRDDRRVSSAAKYGGDATTSSPDDRRGSTAVAAEEG